MKTAKQVKQLISNVLTDRKAGISVKLGESDNVMDRIEINFKENVSFNPIKKILQKQNFFIAQIINFYYPNKRTALLIRYKKK